MTDMMDTDQDEEAPFTLERHIRYFSTCLRTLPAPYVKLDTNRLTLVHFAVHALDILSPDLWNDATKQSELGINKQSIIQWIYDLQIRQPNEPPPQDALLAPISHVGFLGGTFLGPIPKLTDRSSGAHYDYHQGHIAMTYTALCTLNTLGDDLSRIDKFGILASLEKLQQPDGSFTCVAGGGDRGGNSAEHDMRFLFCACAISYMLDDWSGVDKMKAVEYIKNCRAYDGGIALIPGQEGHGGSTFCGVAALVLMDQVEDVLCRPSSESDMFRRVGPPSVGKSCWKDELIHWCVHRQVGGMQGRPNKAEDTCYSYWIGGTLRLLGHEELLDGKKLRNYILSCQYDLGGFGKVVNAFPDVLHSFYSLAWLSLSSHPNPQKAQSMGVKPLPIEKLNCTLGIRQTRADQFGHRSLP